MRSQRSFSMADSQENLDESGSGYGNASALDNLAGGRKSEESSGLGFKLDLKLKERLFLFAFDLIELNQVFNFIIYTLFLLIDFIFLAYYPANQIYADFVVLRPTSMKQDQLQFLKNWSFASNFTIKRQENVISVLSSAYENIKDTGLYSEEIIYDKRIPGENRDKVVTQVLSYLNLDYLLDNMNLEDFVVIQGYFCHVFLVFYFLFIAMILTRQPGTINLSGQRRLITKLFSFLVVLISKAAQMPFITFMLKIFACSNEEQYFDKLQAAILSSQKLAVQQDSSFSGSDQFQQQTKINVPFQEYCYTGSHLSQVIYASAVIIMYYTLVGFFHYFMTLSYPHEKIPWACLPTKIPIIREALKFVIVLSYQETNISRNALSYLDIIYAVIWAFVIYKRIRHVLIFHKTVYYTTIVGETSLFVIFGFAALRDFVAIDRNFILHLVIAGSCIFASAIVILLREKVRLKSLSKVDFALYEKDFEALIMMFTLHELIESSSYDEAQDFLLRGFIERHIEICEFPQCTCIRYYQISNQNYRLELAQISPFSRMYDSNAAMSQMNLQQQQTRNNSTMVTQTMVTKGPGQIGTTANEQEEVDELSTLKVFYGGGKKNQQKQNKKKSKFLKKFLIDNINVFLEIFPGSVKLHIMAAFIYFSIFKNSFKSLYELSFTKSKKSSLQDKYECFVLSSQVIAYFQSRASQGMSNQPVQFEKAQKDDKKGKGQGEFNSSSFEVESEIKSVIEFEKINIKFQKMIEQTSLQTRKFWQEILKKNIDVEKVFGLGAKIYKNFVDIKKQYRHLMQLNNNYLEVAYLYKLFVSLILNFEIEVEDAKLEIVKIMQTKSMKKHNLKAEYKTIQLLEENGMIIISGSTGNFGKILAMNNKAERTFGYGTNELMAQKLHRLMPRLFADNHEDLILNFINGNRRINKENHQFVWGKHKSGFIIPLIMEINAYVNFEFNFCFIAFLKRSILLEFKPMRELLEYQDIFVMQVSSTGAIQDMTQNMQEYLNFPIQALNKDISAEQFFRGLFDDELEQSFLNGRRMEFDPGVIKRVLEQEDIDVRGDGESDAGGGFNVSEKKCVAIVQLKNYDYTEQDIKLTYKEVWFVLTEDDSTFLDTRNTTEYMTAFDQGENVKANVTYTDDREEICSIASMSSLANYDKNRKNIMAKLSEIKTQTIDDQKPKQIDLLQKAIILVFLAVIAIALLLLAVSSDRNSGFLTNVDIIQQSKQAALYFTELRLLLSSLVYFSNSRQFNFSDPELSKFTDSVLTSSKQYIEQLRQIQSYMNFVEFDYSDKTFSKKKGMAQDFMQIRSNKIIEGQRDQMSMIQGIKEFLDVANDITAITGATRTDFAFNTSILNYDNSNSSLYQGQQIGQTAINLYQLLKNGHGMLGNYLLDMSENYIRDATFQANNNSSLVLILTIVSIAITCLTAFVILPILHKIERSKEKVLMIYTELKKEQIESLNRNIKVFFMKLQTGANQVSNALSYQGSSKQFSGKLVTRKFTMNPSSMKRMSLGDYGDDIGIASRTASNGKLDMIGSAEMLEEDTGRLRGGKNSGGIGKAKYSDPFNRMSLGGKRLGGQHAVSILPGSSPKKKKGTIPFKQSGSKKSSTYSGSQDPSRIMSKLSKVNENEREKGGHSDADEDMPNNAPDIHDMMLMGEDETGNQDNDEEDMRAKQLMSKEEAENSMFKRLFQNKIKQMTCVRQAKYYTLVALISLIMCGYFTLSYFMVTNIFKDSQQSLEIYNIVGNRGPYLDSLLSSFMQSQIRKTELYVSQLDRDDYSTGGAAFVNAIDYYMNLTQSNQNAYSALRLSSTEIISSSKTLINGLETQDMCSFIITEQFVKENNALLNQTQGTTKVKNMEDFMDECKAYSSRILQLGMQQTINSIMQTVLQGTIQFRDGVQRNNISQALLKLDKEQQLFMTIMMKTKYLNRVDSTLLQSFKDSIIAYFAGQQSQYVVVFSIFISLMVVAMIVLSFYGVEYLFKNLIAIKFILNFIPGQWLIENNAADDLKYVEF